MRFRRADFLRLLGLGIAFRPRSSFAAPESAGGEPVRIGVITDCQYADADPPKDGKRQYRKSPQKLANAVAHLNKMGDLDFVIHLGDMIDREFGSYDVVMPIFDRLKAPRYQLLGNHDFDIADYLKPRVPDSLGMGRRYHAWTHKGWRFIALDGTDVSLFAHAKDSEPWKAAQAAQKAGKRKLEDWNGAIGPTQLAWLKQELEAARKEQHPAIVFCHYPILPVEMHALWNAEEVLDLLKEYADVVKVWCNGHNHDGNYAARHGIHCLNFKGMVDTMQNSYARVELFADRMEVTGFGREPTRTLRFPAEDAQAESERASKAPAS